MRHNKALQVQLNTSQGLEASLQPAKPGQASEGRRAGRGAALAGALTGWLCCTGCIADARTRQRQHRTLHLRSATFLQMAAGQTESPVCQKTSTRGGLVRGLPSSQCVPLLTHRRAARPGSRQHT